MNKLGKALTSLNFLFLLSFGQSIIKPGLSCFPGYVYIWLKTKNSVTRSRERRNTSAQSSCTTYINIVGSAMDSITTADLLTAKPHMFTHRIGCQK